RLSHAEPGAGQALAIRAHRAAQTIRNRGQKVTVQWVPGHSGIEGNERADQAAKRAAGKCPRGETVGLSLAFVRRMTSEARKKNRNDWVEVELARRAPRQRDKGLAKGNWKLDPVGADGPKKERQWSGQPPG